MHWERTRVFRYENGRSGATLEGRGSRFARSGDARRFPRLRAMLLSDRDITAAIAEGRLGIEPYDTALVQPSSIDVRLDRFFRVFNNSRYTHIDPAQQQDDLTTLIEPDGDDPFVLHPGEFVLGSTLEVVGPRRPRRQVGRQGPGAGHTGSDAGRLVDHGRTPGG